LILKEVQVDAFRGSVSLVGTGTTPNVLSGEDGPAPLG
jgi:hypothetical protein